jgi:ABC-type sugar transport system ATPase subunit
MIDAIDICLTAGKFQLRKASLQVLAGEYFVLMGRTGSGKSLLLQCVCGLRQPSSGRIAIAGRDVTHLEPRDRNLGYMPQDTGLFPHLGVWRNVTFSLRARGVRRNEARRLAMPLVEMLGIVPLLDRDCRDLSGGEKQKVALARALACSPNALLLDEPVSALDEPARAEVCAELRRVQQTLNLSVIHVCHSLAEAAIADRVGVIDDGLVQQTGPLRQLRENPATKAVARLMAVEERRQ